MLIMLFLLLKYTKVPIQKILTYYIIETVPTPLINDYSHFKLHTYP